MSISTLYLSYFGLREPLVQTQVVPYLREIAAAGIKVSLLTFEPRLREEWGEAELAKHREQLASENISWFCLPYHKSPSLPATVYDITAGARFASRMIRREGINVLHTRGHVPMAMALLARSLVRRNARGKLLFDIRGFVAEEYVDGKVWAENSPQFRALKMVERAGLRNADEVVVLTHRMRNWLIEHELKSPEQIEVIPCCVDFERFETGQAGPGQANLAETVEPLSTDRFEIVYAGSLTGVYLVEEMGRFFMAVKARRPDAFLRILSISSPEAGAAALKRAGLEEKDFSIGVAHPAEVPAYLRRARLGVSFRKATFAQIASSPTKIPEYLAVGLPVVCNAGIGDMDDVVERERVGVVLSDFEEQSYATAAEQALRLAEDEEVRARAVRVAHQYFDLKTVGGRRYVNVYRRLGRRLFHSEILGEETLAK
jgi:glycosyltransferase involved in cell wall biosynthesis